MTILTLQAIIIIVKAPTTNSLAQARQHLHTNHAFYTSTSNDTQNTVSDTTLWRAHELPTDHCNEMETFGPESAQRKRLATIANFLWAAKDPTSINQRIQNPDITWVPTKNRKNRSIYGYSRTSIARRPSEAIARYTFHQSPLFHIFKAWLTHPQTLTSRNIVHKS